MSSSPSTTSSDFSSSSAASNLDDNVSQRRRDSPRWLAASLALTTVTASIVIPGIIYLRRRQKMKIFRNSAPPRRVQISPVPDSLSPTRVQIGRQSVRVADVSPALTSSSRLDRADPTSSFTSETPVHEVTKLDFSPTLYTFKALGMATLFVTVGAVATFWGTKIYLGVEDPRELTHEVAERMRKFVVTKMPVLSARIHGSHLDEKANESSTPSLSLSGSEEWTWHAAENRLRAAYNERGVSAWADAALKELEEEEKVERRKRNMMKEGARKA